MVDKCSDEAGRGLQRGMLPISKLCFLLRSRSNRLVSAVLTLTKVCSPSAQGLSLWRDSGALAEGLRSQGGEEELQVASTVHPHEDKAVGADRGYCVSSFKYPKDCFGERMVKRFHSLCGSRTSTRHSEELPYSGRM